MKKFLTIILAMVMLLVPMGSVSCFADRGEGSDAVFTPDVDQIQDLVFLVEVMVKENGDYFGEVNLILDGGVCVGSISLSELTKLFNEERIKLIDFLLRDLEILNLMILSRSFTARVLFEISTENTIPASIYLYSTQEPFVKVIKKNVHLSAFDLSA